MNWIETLFGHGKDLNVLQMSMRSIIIFFICLILIRISGRRSFGLRAPLDNIIVILLGALLSRTIVGASPFLPVVAASFVFVVLHRMLCWLMVRNDKISRLVEGNKIILFRDNKFIKENLKKGLVTEEDVMQGVRKSALTDDMSKIDKVYIERNGAVSPVKKDD